MKVFSPEVQCLLIAYTVDLILVLEELFKITLQPSLSGKISWDALQAGFEAYQRSMSLHSVHNEVRLLVEKCGRRLDKDGIRSGVDQLVKHYRQST